MLAPHHMRYLFNYGGVINYHCYADKGAWGSLVSSNGTHRYTRGILSAATIEVL